jgi:hypothetical protein
MKTYAPEEVSLILDGNIISGFAEGTFISVARDEDAFTYVASTSGGGTRTKNANKAGKITFTLQQSSESNSVCSALLKKDEDTSDALFPVLCRDNSGSDLHKAEVGYLVKAPQSDYAKELSNREYIVQCENLEMFLGGN